MKILIDKEPNDCTECIWGISNINCTILNKPLNQVVEDWEYRGRLEDCPLRPFSDIQIRTEVKHGFYSDDMLKVSLVLDDEELTSDEFVYKDYHGSDDD